ncbi:vrlQ [Beggiatoa sp. PS]|nr:vrlQ [Beggiatoa sp. PS]
MSKNAPIGFSQIIKYAWLDFTAQKKLEGYSSAEVRAALEHFLSNQISVGNNSRRNSRQKAISILSKIWLHVPQSLVPFRDEGLVLFKSVPKNTRIALHFGMAMAVYPFLHKCRKYGTFIETPK